MSVEQVFFKKQISVLEEALKNLRLEIEGTKANSRYWMRKGTAYAKGWNSLLDLLADIEVAK
jgi:hypothetical protein